VLNVEESWSTYGMLTGNLFETVHLEDQEKAGNDINMNFREVEEYLLGCNAM
jgi:hypothetical protein